jgi:hypothetical protein
VNLSLFHMCTKYTMCTKCTMYTGQMTLYFCQRSNRIAAWADGQPDFTKSDCIALLTWIDGPNASKKFRFLFTQRGCRGTLLESVCAHLGMQTVSSGYAGVAQPGSPAINILDRWGWGADLGCGTVLACPVPTHAD